MRMHVLEVSESTSSIAEHDLSDLVPSYSPAHLYRQHSDESSPNSNDSSYFPAVRSGSHFASPENVPLSRPPAAIVYAASTAAHSSSTNTSSTSQHPVSLIPTVSPPRYQLSLSHPGTPPSRNHARRTESYPPEARRAPPSPPLSQYSAPTILQQQEQRQNSIVAYDATWHDRSNATRAVSVPAVVSQSHVRPGLASLPEYEIDDEAQLDPVSEEQHARITKEQYRLGVGYDEHASGTTGKRISDQRRLERLKALEKEFGRVKMQSRSQSWNGPPTPTSKEEEDNRKASSKTSKSDPEKKVYPHKHEDDDDDAEDSSVKMTFKEMRVKEKEERARLNKELGITKDGNLLTQGRKTRLALRWTQGLLGFLAVICGLGGAFFTNPPEDEEPAPSGAVSTWFLYIVSLGSLICSIYLFTIQPCLRRSQSKKAEANGTQLLPGAMPNGIVLPIFSSASHSYDPLGRGKKGAFGKKYKKNKGYMMHGQQQQPMTVNLVVDPSMLGGTPSRSKPPSRYDESSYDDEDDEEVDERKKNKLTSMNGGGEVDEADSEDDHDFQIPNSRLRAEQARKERQNQPLARMMDTMAVMKLQDKWREARRRMRKLAWIDAAWSIVWWAEAFFAIGSGGSCKPGSGAGWCDTYNMALASAVLLALAFSTSFTFDILDLRRSRSTPRISRTV